MEKIYVYSLLDSTVLVSCSKPPQNWFARFDQNRFWFCKWNEKSDESKTSFGLSNGIRPKSVHNPLPCY